MSGSELAGMPPALLDSALPLPLIHRGKVREMYEAGPDLLLMVASDRVSAFDVVMRQPIPRKGEVLTLLTAWWLDRMRGLVPHHVVAARPEEILVRVPALAELPEGRHRWERRSLLVRRARPLPIECVVRGYLAGSAWAEYRKSGTLAGEPLPARLVQSQRLDPPIFSPATKADEGHDENITFDEVASRIGPDMAGRLRSDAFRIYEFARDAAAERGILLADTKFEFGVTPEGELLLIDEVLTPDSSRYWPASEWKPGSSPPSLDKQPIRDWLDALADWDRTPPPPDLTDEVVAAATERYLEIFRRLTGTDLDRFDPPFFNAEARGQ
ncbi:MAG: phosphoribosylaminoimidazolesuccinocarboxamide synthase [Gemmatimonadota bacterium]